MTTALEFFRLLRPKQWVKSLFVLVGLLFGHAWGDMHLVWRVLAAAGGFALVSSCIYIINDMADRDADRQHPVKRHRPLARGSVSIGSAASLAIFVGILGAVLGYYASPLVAMMLALYGLMNLAYTFGLKRVVILDVFIIASGFMLRILAGTSGVGIPPSQWLLLCGLMLTLFLGFVKRRAELKHARATENGQRKVLNEYSAALLDPMITITATGIIMSYSLYTLSPETIAMHGTSMLMLSVPFVIYGVFRYLFLLHRYSQGEDAASEIVQDAHLVVTFLAWLAVTFWLIALR